MTNNRERIRKGKGFTLSELLVVIIVIAVLGAIAVPVYTKAIKRSRASDALKVLSLASAKQESYLINHDKYAANFTDLSAPVKGLTGTGEVNLGHFKYTMDKNCIRAKRQSDDYMIIKNFDTQEEGCIGDGCKYIQNLVPTVGSVGCDITNLGIGDGTGGGTDPCIANPDLCKGPGGVTCPAGKIYSPALKSCICAISSCGANGVLNPTTCTCSCNGTCAGGKVMSDTCECECPSDKPYFYNNQCSVCPSGAPKADGSCCAANQCYSGGKCINKLVPDGTTTETMACGKTGTQTRTFNEGCPGSWGPWTECKCPAGQELKDGECKATSCDVTTLCPGVTEQRKTCDDGVRYQVRKPDNTKCPEGWGAWSACQCPSGYIWKDNTCKAKTACPAVCPAGQQRNSAVSFEEDGACCKAKTACPATCPSGQIRNTAVQYQEDGNCCMVGYKFNTLTRQIAAGRYCKSYSWSEQPEPGCGLDDFGCPWMRTNKGEPNSFSHFAYAESFGEPQTTFLPACYCVPGQPRENKTGTIINVPINGQIWADTCPANTANICAEKCSNTDPTCSYKCVKNVTPVSGCGMEYTQRTCFFSTGSGCCIKYSCHASEGPAISEDVNYAPLIGSATLVYCQAQP